MNKSTSTLIHTREFNPRLDEESPVHDPSNHPERSQLADYTTKNNSVDQAGQLNPSNAAQSCILSGTNRHSGKSWTVQTSEE